MHYLAVACRVALLTVLVVAAFGKVRDRTRRAAFLSTLLRSRTVPRNAVRPVATLVIMTEFGIAALLAVTDLAAWGLALATGLFVVFTITLVRLRRLSVPCRCFGAGQRAVGRQEFVRNALLLAIAGLGYWAIQMPPGPAEVAGVVIAGTAGLLVALLLMSVDQLAYLWSGPSLGSS